MGVIFLSEGFLTDNGLHGSSILGGGVVSIELVGNGRVILSILLNSLLHESGKGRQHVDGRIDLLVVELSVDEDLSLSDVAGQIGNGMGDIVVGHGENRNLGDGTVSAVHSTGSLVDGRQIGIEITGVGSSTRHFFSSSRHLSQRVSIGAHIGHDNQHVKFLFIGQILGGSQGKSRSDNSLNRGIVGQVQEKHHSLHGTVLLEIGSEESGHLHVDTHGGKHHTEIFL